MTTQQELDVEQRSRGLIWVCLCWFAVGVVLYVLSVGPVAMLVEKKLIGPSTLTTEFLTTFYKPLEWAYNKTMLHKPLGLYYHLWIPSVIDSKGNIIGGS
jgi:hypothetical protein